jgi:hypothetical protein
VVAVKSISGLSFVSELHFDVHYPSGGPARAFAKEQETALSNAAPVVARILVIDPRPRKEGLRLIVGFNLALALPPNSLEVGQRAGESPVKRGAEVAGVAC